MLDSLALLLEKAFVVAIFYFFSVIPFKKERKDIKCPKRTEETMQFQRGDLLEVPRTLFVHFGIYLGDGKVAHLMPDILPVLTRNKCHIQNVVTNKRLLLGVLYKYATIRVDKVEDFAYGSPISLNTMDTTLRKTPLANEEVALRAEKLVGRIPYSLLWNNCEHFVTYCRYGTGISLQTDKFCECLKSVIRDQRSVLITTLIGMFSIFFLGLTPATALPTVLIPFVLWMAG
ncbi:lecithin retinol acyltransferase-like [Electrophorus electricus]|uniref:LRAT domain-containing protein n=1 Tax=Electrophorus electricus TaxID=8005 RepID=A0A4W4FL79_ELEEL|nr:lecithin retinol acyltransferase-like [Electrophorus electricus]